MAVNSYFNKKNSTTVNPYFDHIRSTPEQSLYDALTVENIKCSGIDVWFIPRTDTNIDYLFKESYKTFFNNSYKIEAFFENPGDWGGSGEILTKFGFAQQDNVNLIVSKTSFGKLKIPDRIKPTEGDLIYIGDNDANKGYGSFTNSIFEITFVDNEKPFWQIGKVMVYNLSCRMFSFGYEKFNTGNNAIDLINDALSNESDLQQGGVNTDVKTKSKTLLDFTENNPFNNI